MKPVINLEKFWKFCGALRIEDKESGLVPIIPFNTQKYLVNQIAEGLEEGIHTFTVLKFRQAGATTIGLALDLYWLNKFGGMPGTFVSDSDSNREHFRSVLDGYIKSLAGGHWHIGVKSHNRNQLVFDNRSRLTYQVASSRNDRLGQGKGIAFMHATECASWNNDQGLMSLMASLAEINPNRLYIFESTAQGYNLWYDVCKDAKDSVVQKFIFLGWWMHERYRVEKGSQIFRVYWDGKLDRDERDWVRHVKQLYDYEVQPEQVAWWRYQLAEKFHGDLTTLMQEMPPCVTGDTRVGSKLGIIPIREAFIGMQATRGKVEKTFPTEDVPVWKLRTRLGYELRGTWDHPMMSEAGVLIPLRSCLGHKIRLAPPMLSQFPYRVKWTDGPMTTTVEITPELARLIGIFMGDGSFQRRSAAKTNDSGVGQLSISCDAKDEDFIQATEVLMESILGVRVHRQVVRGCVILRCSGSVLWRLFDRLGLLRSDTGPTQRLVHVPEFIFRSPANVVREFLSGLFETDGFSDGKSSRIVLFSVYSDFMRDVQILLLAFGITSRRTINAKRKNKTHEYRANELNLRGEEAHRFHEEIGFLSHRKRVDNRYLTKSERATKIVEADEVTLIEEAGRETVYNLEIEDEHLFDANGLLTHNTEHDAFQLSGAKFFDGVKVNEALRGTKNEKYLSFKFQIGSQWSESKIVQTIPRYAELKMWEPPHEGATYVVAGDPAYGSSEWKDNFCAQVFRCYADGMEQVAEYASTQCSTEAFAWMLCYLAGFYKNSTLILEINGPGQYVWNEMQNLRRNAAGQRSVDGRSFIGAIQMFMYRRIDSTSTSAAYQWKSTHELKIAMLTGFKDNFESGRIQIRSPELCEEMVKIVRDETGDLAASGRGKDDRVIAAGMTTVPWLRSLRIQLSARNMTRDAARATEDKPVLQTALQTVVSNHLAEIGYRPPQQIAMK